MGIFNFRKKMGKQKELCFPEKNKYVTEKTILSEQIKTGSFSFEMENTEVSIILDDRGKHYMRVYKKVCSAENNGRPVTTISDYCYPIETSDGVTAANWKEYAHFWTELNCSLYHTRVYKFQFPCLY